MKRLDKLTSEQEAMLPVIRDEWLSVGLSTQPADREKAVAAARVAYARANLKEPQTIVWLNSPLAGALGACMLVSIARAQVFDQVGAQVFAQVRDQVGAQVFAQVFNQVGDHVRDQVFAQVRDQVFAQVRDQVGDQVFAQVRDQVFDQVGAQVFDQVGAQVRAHVRAQVGAQVFDQVGAQVRAQVGAQVFDQVGAQVRAQVRAQVFDQVGAQVRAQVGDQVFAQVRAQVGDQVFAQVRDQVFAQVRDQVFAQVRAQVFDQVGAQVFDQVGAQVRAQVGDQVFDQVGDQVGDHVRDQVFAHVRDQVRDQVFAQVFDQVRDQVGDHVRDQVYRCGYGLHDAAWTVFYDTFGRFGIDVSRLTGITGLTQTCGWYWPFAGAIILTERPVALHRNAQHQLHSESGMAIEYPDGWGLYCLNGVRVPAQLVTTPAEKMDCQFILKERNAEIRREFVRKAGIEKVCRDLGARQVDQQDAYELLFLNLGDGRERPYLKMKNPSIGVYHIEGVAPECRTVRQALNWRNSLTDKEIDEVNGSDWYQQGDVVMRPSGVKAFKSQPIILT